MKGCQPTANRSSTTKRGFRREASSQTMSIGLMGGDRDSRNSEKSGDSGELHCERRRRGGKNDVRSREQRGRQRTAKELEEERVMMCLFYRRWHTKLKPSCRVDRTKEVRHLRIAISLVRFRRSRSKSLFKVSV